MNGAGSWSAGGSDDAHAPHADSDVLSADGHGDGGLRPQQSRGKSVAHADMSVDGGLRQLESEENEFFVFDEVSLWCSKRPTLS